MSSIKNPARSRPLSANVKRLMKMARESPQNPDVETVVDDRRVSYNGETLSLTALAKMLSGKKYSIAGPKFFTYKGEPLNDLRHRLGK